MISRMVGLLALLSTLLSCQTKAPSTSEKITSVVGLGYSVEQNKSNTFALCIKSNELSSQWKIVRMQDLKIVREDVLTQGGKISWLEDLKIRIIKGTGIVRADEKPEDYIQIIDLNQYVLNEN